MSFGKNLQFLRKMGNGMTQEELAERLTVSRQTISKWELDMAYPEMEKVIEICNMFSCTMDQLVREDMNVCDEAYSNIRTEEVGAFWYAKYAVISVEPEEDAIRHVNEWAKKLGMKMPKVIGWDFPVVSQEQANGFGMHGYAAALVFTDKEQGSGLETEIIRQEKQKYAAITITQSPQSPFTLIPNAYKVLMAHMKVNGMKEKFDKNIISCFEREYEVDGVWHMDVYIAVE